VTASGGRRLRLVVPVLLVGLLVTGVASSPARAASRASNPGIAHVTFTKWVITSPSNPPSLAGVLMTGLVGGDVGPGRYVGAVRTDDLSQPGFWHATALYGFFGHRHAFEASLRITENDTVTPATAVVRGVVAGGWRHGQSVHGGYTAMNPCPVATPGNVFGHICFQGRLTIAARH
jgi:hypothetical protein